MEVLPKEWWAYVWIGEEEWHYNSQKALSMFLSVHPQMNTFIRMSHVITLKLFLNFHVSTLQSRDVPYKHTQSFSTNICWVPTVGWTPIVGAACSMARWIKEEWLWWAVREGKSQEWLPNVCHETPGRWRCHLLRWKTWGGAGLGENKKLGFGRIMFEMLLRHESRAVTWEAKCPNMELRGERSGQKIPILRVANV